MLSVGVYGKEDKAAVGEMTPRSLLGSLALYPAGTSLAVKPQQAVLYPKYPLGLARQYSYMIGHLCLVIRIDITQSVGIDAHKRIMRKKQRAAIGRS